MKINMSKNNRSKTQTLSTKVINANACLWVLITRKGLMMNDVHRNVSPNIKKKIK